MGLSTRVKVDDMIFNTILEASEFLEIKPYDLSGTLNDTEEHDIKGFKVKRLSPRVEKFCGKIYCMKTGLLFNNAVTLGKYLKINPTYISNKLRTDNKYVDIYGNTYRRVQNEDNFKEAKQLSTKGVYKIGEKEVVETPAVNVPQPITKEDEEIFETTPVISKSSSDDDILKDLTILASKFLKNKDYDTVSNLIEIMKKVDNQ